MNLKNESTYSDPLQSWLVCLTAILFFFEFVQLNMFNASIPAVVQVFHISATCLWRLSVGQLLFLRKCNFFSHRTPLGGVSTQKAIILAKCATGPACISFSLLVFQLLQPFGGSIYVVFLTRGSRPGGSFTYLIKHVRLAFR